VLFLFFTGGDRRRLAMVISSSLTDGGAAEIYPDEKLSIGWREQSYCFFAGIPYIIPT